MKLFQNYASLVHFIERCGGTREKKKITRRVDFMVTGKREGKSFSEKAKKIPTIKILTEEEFLNKVEEIHIRKQTSKKRKRDERLRSNSCSSSSSEEEEDNATRTPPPPKKTRIDPVAFTVPVASSDGMPGRAARNEVRRHVEELARPCMQYIKGTCDQTGIGLAAEEAFLKATLQDVMLRCFKNVAPNEMSYPPSSSSDSESDTESVPVASQDSTAAPPAEVATTDEKEYSIEKELLEIIEELGRYTLPPPLPSGTLRGRVDTNFI